MAQRRMDQVIQPMSSPYLHLHAELRLSPCFRGGLTMADLVGGGRCGRVVVGACVGVGVIMEGGVPERIGLTCGLL